MAFIKVSLEFMSTVADRNISGVIAQNDNVHTRGKAFHCNGTSTLLLLLSGRSRLSEYIFVLPDKYSCTSKIMRDIIFVF